MSRFLAVVLVLGMTHCAASETVPIVATALPPNARVAMIGDSITEQMLFTRYVEAYLLACAGRTDVSVFQFGWGGETAATFLNRLTRGDLDAFMPTAATIAYGANDGGNQPWAEWLHVMWTGRITNAVAALETRYPGLTPTLVICSPTFFEANRDGSNAAGVAISNETLGHFRDIDREVARAHGCGFADLRERMRESSAAAREVVGASYRIGGSDGVHAGPNGHLLMTYEILRAFRLTGAIATISVDLSPPAGASGVTLSPGHTLLSASAGTITLASRRYPFCPAYDQSTADDGLTSILPFVPFTNECNRFMLVVQHLDTVSATITWGSESRIVTRDALAAGVNLAELFSRTPFDSAFATLMTRISAQQVKERDMIKAATDANAPAKGWSDADIAARTALDAASHAAVVAVTHTITIVPISGHDAQLPVVTGGSANGIVGTPFTYPVTVTVADGPVAIRATDLPAGLTIDAISGVIRGVPTVPVMDQMVRILATNAAGTATGSVRLSIHVPISLPHVSSPLTITGIVGVPIAYRITATQEPGKYYATGLPQGLSVVSATGDIVGAPTTIGTTTILLSAENSGGNGPAVPAIITIAMPPAAK